jgi:putative lipoprotein
MKTKFFAALCFAAALFTSCSKDNNDEPKVKPTPGTEQPTPGTEQPTPETAQIKHFETLMPGYDSWVYVDLETGKYEQQEELGAREYRKYNTMTEYEVVKTEPAKGSEKDLPKKWDLAFHITDVRTNDGAVLMTDQTNISSIKTLPQGDYVADVPDYIFVELGAMKAGGLMVASKTMLNKEMAKWAKSTGMGKPKIISDKVFAVKFKNGNEALILFKDYLDATGKKKAVSFDYKFIKKA